MGQGIGRLPEAPGVGGDADPGREPIGRYIARQRRLRGIELEDLAALTRIPRRSLERLEAGAFDHSPDGFSRGFVRTVAEAIGLDPDDAVARMLHEPDTGRRASPRGGRMLGAVAAMVALLALAIAARQLFASLPARTQRPAGQLPVRRDYVRALAEAQGIATAKLTARDAVLAPIPPTPASPAGETSELAGAREAIGAAALAPVAAPVASPATAARSSAPGELSRPPTSELGAAASVPSTSAPDAAAVERAPPASGPESLTALPAEAAAGAAAPVPEPGVEEREPALSDRPEREAPAAQAGPELPTATAIDAEAHD
jgi:cytoskeleton protein RodZ